MRRGPDTGSTLYGPLRVRAMTGSDQTRTERDDIAYRSVPRVECDQMWDFNGKYASGFGEGLAERTTGTPTGVAQANTANGEVTITLAATSEAEFDGLDWTDVLNIPATAYPMFDCRLKTPAATVAAVEDVVFGFSAAYNATLNSIATYARFRFSGNNKLLIEGSDGTNVTSTDTGIVLAAATYRFYTIERKRSDGRFYFFVSNDLVGAISLPLLAVTNRWQPLVGIRKASGTTAPAITLDHMRVRWLRLT